MIFFMVWPQLQSHVGEVLGPRFDPQIDVFNQISVDLFKGNSFLYFLTGPHLDLPCDLMVGLRRELYISTDEGKGLVCQRSENALEVLQMLTSPVDMRRPGCMALTSSGTSLVLCDEVCGKSSSYLFMYLTCI